MTGIVRVLAAGFAAALLTAPPSQAVQRLVDSVRTPEQAPPAPA